MGVLCVGLNGSGAVLLGRVKDYLFSLLTCIVCGLLDLGCYAFSVPGGVRIKDASSVRD